MVLGKRPAAGPRPGQCPPPPWLNVCADKPTVSVLCPALLPRSVFHLPHSVVLKPCRGFWLESEASPNSPLS